MERFAIVTGAPAPNIVAAYLPDAYRVIGAAPDIHTGALRVIIAGDDVAGWTMDGYVIPRLASGLMFARETDHGAAMEIIHDTQ